MARAQQEVLPLGRVGFTLIELAIVMVIIGLILGAVATANELIHAAKLRLVMTDIDRFKTAINTFRNKYNCLPGDCPNAQTFWGTDTSCPTGDEYDQSPHTATCNGNGNGVIGKYGDPWPESYEWWRAWQELAVAGLIEGQYSGHSLPNGYAAVGCSPGQNVPKSRFAKGAGYQLMDYSNANALYPDAFFLRPNRTTIMLGLAGGNGACNGQLMRAVDALQIDRKTDDGKPATGLMLVSKTTDYNHHCVTTTVDATAEYDPTSLFYDCLPMFDMGF